VVRKFVDPPCENACIIYSIKKFMKEFMTFLMVL